MIIIVVGDCGCGTMTATSAVCGETNNVSVRWPSCHDIIHREAAVPFGLGLVHLHTVNFPLYCPCIVSPSIILACATETYGEFIVMFRLVSATGVYSICLPTIPAIVPPTHPFSSICNWPNLGPSSVAVGQPTSKPPFSHIKLWISMLAIRSDWVLPLSAHSCSVT